MALEEIIGPKPGVPFAHAQDSNGGQVPVLSLPADPGTLELIKNAVPGVPFLYAYDPDQDVQMSVVMLHPDSPGTGGGGGGTDGKNGWSPVIGLVDNGPATVMRLVNWLGGSGTKPAVGAYIGATGLVTDINDAVNVRGGQGAKGDTGEAGPAGAKGDTGDTGPKGETGATGATGPKGDKGDTGEAGPKGDTGNQGIKGDPGDQGPAGLTGAKGDKGDAGEKGETGATGAKGDDGEQGPQGSQGATGWTPVLAVAPDGARSVLQVVDWAGTGSNKPTVGMYLGPDGFTSVIAEALTVRGPAGAKGDAGNDGAAGAPGDKGEQGDPGPAGAKGDKGDAGAKGDTGTNGTNGYSPLLTVVARGVDDSVLQVFDWVGSTGPKPPTGQYLGLGGFVEDIADASSIRGVQGPTGAKGDKGDTGDRGPTGLQGEPGATGAKGDTGERGEQGIQGIKGDPGAKGDKGDQGDTGPTGAKGDKGDTGDIGPTGLKGDTGDQGLQGPTGAKGDKGDQGAPGTPGEPGATGAKGDKGDQGDPGPAGTLPKHLIPLYNEAAPTSPPTLELFGGNMDDYLEASLRFYLGQTYVALIAGEDPGDSTPRYVQMPSDTGVMALVSDIFGALAAQTPNNLLMYVRQSMSNAEFGAALAQIPLQAVPASTDQIILSATGVAGTPARRASVQQLANSLITLMTASFRPKITFARTYYVRSDGSDSNTGLTNSTGGAFKTIQKAIDTVAGFDLNGFTVTIRVVAATFPEPIVFKDLTGPGNVLIRGHTNDYTAIISNPDTMAFQGTFAGKYTLQYLTITAPQIGIEVRGSGATVEFSDVEFGASTIHLSANEGATIRAIGNYRVAGGAMAHVGVYTQGRVIVNGRTLTMVGTPAWGSNCLSANENGLIVFTGNTISGASTGKKYSAGTGGGIVLYTGAVPGDTAGTATAPGWVA